MVQIIKPLSLKTLHKYESINFFEIHENQP